MAYGLILTSSRCHGHVMSTRHKLLAMHCTTTLKLHFLLPVKHPLTSEIPDWTDNFTQPAHEKADRVRNLLRCCFPNITASIKLWSCSSWTRGGRNTKQPVVISLHYRGHCVSPSHLTAQIKAWIAVTASPLFLRLLLAQLLTLASSHLQRGKFTFPTLWGDIWRQQHLSCGSPE